MSHLTAGDKDLHHPDGSHRTTPVSTSGRALEAHERRLRAHLELHAAHSDQTTVSMESTD